MSDFVNYQLIPQQRPYEFNNNEYAQMQLKEWNKYVPGWAWKYLDFDRSCSKNFVDTHNVTYRSILKIPYSDASCLLCKETQLETNIAPNIPLLYYEGPDCLLTSGRSTLTACSKRL